MGNLCPSSKPAEETEETPFHPVPSSQLTRSLPIAEYKLLLLGAGDSGKSTFFKQTKLLYSDGFTEDERKTFVELIHAHVLLGCKIICAGAKELGLLTEELAVAFEPFLALAEQWPVVLSSRQGADLELVWKSDAIQETWRRRLELSQQTGEAVLESLKHFCQHLGRITSAGYIPTTVDILRVRARTSGVVTMTFDNDSGRYNVVDVGGQRSERRKWVNCFENVNALLFFAPVSEYDQFLFEDTTTNRMVESLELFEQICNSHFFKDSHIVLLLNKADVFRQKIASVDLKCCFPDYTGGCDYDAAAAFVRNKFLACNKTEKQIYVNMTNATDESNVRVVFDSIQEIVTQNASEIGEGIHARAEAGAASKTSTTDKSDDKL